MLFIVHKICIVTIILIEYGFFIFQTVIYFSIWILRGFIFHLLYVIFGARFIFVCCVFECCLLLFAGFFSSSWQEQSEHSHDER
jgi:hypothetical protein